MIYLLLLLPATGLTIAGYLGCSYPGAPKAQCGRSESNWVFWAFTLAGLLILRGIFAAAHHGHHCTEMEMHERMHGPRSGAEYCPDTDSTPTPPATR
jgi:hypothetical protein